jgi:hypothetical protein
MDNAEMYQMIIQAITESNDELTAKIDDLRTEMNVRFDVVDNRFDKLDIDIDYLKSKVHEHDRDIFMLKKKI